MRFYLIIILSHLGLSTVVYAQNNKATDTWYGHIDVGYIASMGSTSGSKETFRGKSALNYKGAYWTQTLTVEGVSVRDEIPAANDTERYLSSYKARHFFGDANFFTLRAQWEKDLLSSSEYQAFVSLGLGKELIKTDKHYLKIETGPGVRHSELRFAPPKDNAIALLSFDYDWKISDNTKFIHKSTVEAGEDNTITRLQHQLKQNITKVVALTINHDYKHDNGPKNTREGVLSIGLNYQF